MNGVLSNPKLGQQILKISPTPSAHLLQNAWYFPGSLLLLVGSGKQVSALPAILASGSFVIEFAHMEQVAVGFMAVPSMLVND